MSGNKKGIRLTEEEVAEIKRQARAKLGECNKTRDIIGPQIFSILSLYARVLYYPLGKDGPWGITYLAGTENTEFGEKPFVAINTSISVDKQVFAAAHELYHIWFDKKAEAITSSILDNLNGQNIDDISEQKASRFAAEFLVDEELLHREMKLYSIMTGNITVKNIFTLANIFTVPYRAMVKRLLEIGAINNEDCNKYLNKSESAIEQLRKRFSIPIPDADGRIALDNLVDLAISAYEKRLILYEKIEYLLSLSKLKPEDIGISKPEVFIPPSDDVLDEIIEE